MYVHDFMSKPPVTIGPEKTLHEALEKMEAEGIRRIPVVEGGRLVGILTRSDIESEAGKPSAGRHPIRLYGRRVSDIMTPEPATVNQDETIERAALVMLQHKVSGLPVMEDERVVGVITETDLFRAMVDIFGFDDHGARVVVELNEPDALTKWLEKFAAGMMVRAVVTYHDPADHKWKAVVRVRGRRPATVPQ